MQRRGVKGHGSMLSTAQRELELLSREATRPEWSSGGSGGVARGGGGGDPVDPVLGVTHSTVVAWLEKDASDLAVFLRERGGAGDEIDDISRAGVFEAFGAAIDMFERVHPTSPQVHSRLT